jgi:hypothetical protein
MELMEVQIFKIPVEVQGPNFGFPQRGNAINMVSLENIDSSTPETLL